METTFSVGQAARHLGLTDQGTRKLLARGELRALPGSDPLRLDAQAVDAVLRLRQEDAVRDLARRGSSAVALAREARRVLLPGPHESEPLPERAGSSWQLRMSLVPAAARTLFGVAALTAVGSRDGCRWCRAQDFARVLGGWAPTVHGEAFAVLFDQEPCEVCAGRLYGPVLASLRARVHKGAVRPSGPSPRPSEAERQAAREWVGRHPSAAAVRPVADDDGKALVARRLRETRARLKAAKRSGDQRYAITLARTVRDLEADAARVDGRSAVTAAAARPGTLRCGHRLSEDCSCPRRASRGAR